MKYTCRIASSPDRRFLIAAQVILLLGVAMRIFFLEIPIGNYTDESINAYDSWCLLHYGVDQHLASYPVYLKSWGSGQSALYAYLGMPFIKMFGLSLPAYRLPMAFISSFSLILFYYTLRKTQINYLYILVIILLFVASPWHIMKSRWALDCNLSPDFVLIGTSLFILGYYKQGESIKQSLLYISGCVSFALAAYSYGVSWFMLPFYCVFLGIYFYRHHKISVKKIALCLSTLMIILFPLILFAIQIVTEGEQYQIGPVTITSLNESRHESETILGASNFLPFLYSTVKSGIYLLVMGDDRGDVGRISSFYLFGIFYNIIASPFILYSFYYLYRKKAERNIFDSIMGIWLLATIPIMLLVYPNVYHWNLLWFPLIYFSARGIFFVIRNRKYLIYIAFAAILCLTVVFGKKYVTFHSTPNQGFPGFLSGYKDLLLLAKSKNPDHIYFNWPHSLVLFYDPISPYLYQETRILGKENKAFEQIAGFSNYRLYLPEDIAPTPRTAYLIYNPHLNAYEIDYSKFNVERGESFTLLWTD
ncbi:MULTISPECIES: hypothetical protein [unclassified Dysgonomonas]|uniref:ArnT family glycosyltransferase n=1 Tax=unclassified Dysgonomonas TaxID=2630389 RepID=UPI002475752C|nr:MULTISPECIES: hypothetical protein [unclassified Dysgonomonas]